MFFKRGGEVIDVHKFVLVYDFDVVYEPDVVHELDIVLDILGSRRLIYFLHVCQKVKKVVLGPEKFFSQIGQKLTKIRPKVVF